MFLKFFTICQDDEVISSLRNIFKNYQILMAHLSWKRVWEKLLNLLYRRTILILSLLFVMAVAIALTSMANLSNMLIRAQAFQSAQLSANALNTARTLYSDHVVSRVKDLPDVDVAHDYYRQPHSIPNPATYTIELGILLSEKPGTLVRLYSDYPFPHRLDTGGPKDAFQRSAIEHLTEHPEEPFFEQTQLNGNDSFRYAEAIIMHPSCVACHNSHPDSPRKDWRVGDVRGVLEISQPVDSLMGLTLKSLQGTLLRLVVVLGLGLLGLAFVIGRLRHTTQELKSQVAEQTQELQRLASVDGLTQLFNRRSFDQCLEKEWRRAGHSKRPISLILCDVDCFKKFNDTYGHPAGDTCLQTVAQVIQQKVRQVGDVAARYGGEEFAIILPNTTAASALHVAELIRKAMQERQIPSPSTTSNPVVTLSLGIATQVPQLRSTPSELIDQADHALYMAKRQGRNRSVEYSG